MTNPRYSLWSGCIVMTALILAFIALTGCKSETVDGYWQDGNIVIDGKIDDWEGIPTHLFEKQMAAVAMCNDSSNLYLVFRFRDPALARTIRMSGLTLWIDNTGGSDKDFGVKYNGAPEMEFSSPEGMPADGSAGERRQRLSMMKEKNPVQFMLIDKGSIFQEAIIPVDGREGPAVACDTSLSFFTYEFRIPLVKSELNYYGIDAVPGRDIAIGAVWGGTDDRRGMDGPPSGGMSGGPGGGIPGGGRPGGMRPGGRRPSGFEEQEVWITLTLAAMTNEE